ncbi:hypothetical protein ACFQ07_02490 [Actinomadura adrarensis]|uniref:WXG100 family type VII secretion target n=1 Tax=Actinomadura adrarensis TaxID=1819600 RepID=A0ABW3CBP8_9ACTN
MSNALGAAAGLAQAATVEAMVAAVIIPAAIPIVPITYLAQGDPQELWEAADGWKETIDELERAQAKIEELYQRRLSEQDWKGDDRTAFEGKMKELVNQLDAAIVMAWCAAISLWILAVLTAVFIYMMFVMCSILAIFAAAIAIAAGTVVGAPAALQMEAQANQFAAQFHRILSIGSESLRNIFHATAAIFALFIAGNVGAQAFKFGNPGIFKAMGQATLNSWDDVLLGTLAYGEQKFTAKLMGEVPVFRSGPWKPALGLPSASRVAPITGMEANAFAKGLVDTAGGGPTLSGRVEELFNWVNGGQRYGTDETKAPSDQPGVKYVQDTQPELRRPPQ